ncbi:sulfotransferase [Alteromonas sp. ASW11-36]|uniref:Sulfotransferase n=1 Tax=Alteromonas arenosi TaxID=3055817 RepID=A0ABT7SVX9_9ALTE|nr:sulfotransferase [Alteromonas sp. ASW11-36]MDM7859709.1 sulfotransferase [Alteromonas sp. ASW11-36]
MVNKSFIFLAGHHRSGTSLLHEIIRNHKDISGMVDTGVPEDEGQHLQSVFKPASEFGGAGKYIFDANSYMNESHELATEASAQKILEQWESYLDSACSHYIEKSPPNLIRTRFLQRLFPNSKFIVILRHPLAVAFATQKWSKSSIKSLIEHTLRGYELFAEDSKYLQQCYVLQYESFIARPQIEVDKIFEFLDMESIEVTHHIRQGINEKYFNAWEKHKNKLWNKLIPPINQKLELRANKFGYSLLDYRNEFARSLSSLA